MSYSPIPDPTASRRRFTRAVLAWALLAMPPVAFPAPPAPSHGAPVTRWEPFDGGAWARLQRELPRPSVVVFTTTDCAHCPPAIEKIDRARHAGSPVAPLVVVVMDVAPGDDAAPAAAWRTADRLMAFDGPERSLRYTVDPRWTGVTPYVALLAPGAPPRFVMGAPTDADWSWLRPAAASRR